MIWLTAPQWVSSLRVQRMVTTSMPLLQIYGAGLPTNEAAMAQYQFIVRPIPIGYLLFV